MDFIRGLQGRARRRKNSSKSHSSQELTLCTRQTEVYESSQALERYSGAQVFSQELVPYREERLDPHSVVELSPMVFEIKGCRFNSNKLESHMISCHTLSSIIAKSKQSLGYPEFTEIQIKKQTPTSCAVIQDDVVLRKLCSLEDIPVLLVSVEDTTVATSDIICARDPTTPTGVCLAQAETHSANSVACRVSLTLCICGTELAIQQLSNITPRYDVSNYFWRHFNQTN